MLRNVPRIELVASVFLFIFNTIIVAPLYLGGYTRYSSSIEPAFISDGKFIAQNFPNIGWYPLWYGGFPFHLTYPPVVPFLIAGLNVMTNGALSPVSAYRLMIAFCYCVTPVLIYLFLRYLTGRNAGAIVGALTYSVVPSLVLPGSGNALPIDLTLLVIYGEGPHVVALAFIPVSLILFFRALRKRTALRIALASISISMVILSDLIAAFALALILIVILCSEFLKNREKKEIASLFSRAALVVLATMGLVSFWYNYSFLRASYEFGAVSGPTHSSLFPSFLITIGLSVAMLFAFRAGVARRKSISLILVLIISALLIALSYYDFGLNAYASIILFVIVSGGLALGYRSNIEQRQALFIGIIWSIVFILIILAWETMNIDLAPQPDRYFPELMMGLSILVAIVCEILYGQLRHGAFAKQSRFLALSVGVSMIFFVAVSFTTIPASWSTTASNPNFQSEPIFQTASYLGTHISANQSVFETSYYAFWLNVFTNVPQVRGGSDQASLNSKWWSQVMYLVLYGSNPDLSVLWLRAFNVKYIVTYTNSVANTYSIHQDYYNPYLQNYTFGEFSGVLPLVSNLSGTMIYEIPSESGLASIVNVKQIQSIGTIESITDLKGISEYVNASTPIENASYSYSNPDTVVIHGEFQNASMGIMVKMNYDPSWYATTSSGVNVPIVADPIGFMLLEPGTNGNLTITLHYGISNDVKAGYIVSSTTIAIMVLCIAVETTRGRKRARSKNGAIV